MKNVAITVSLVMMAILTFFIIDALSTREYRTVELSEAVDNALAAAVNNVADNKCYTIHNNDEFVDDFRQLMMTSLDSDSQISVDVLKADYEKGILSVKVTEDYKYINGRSGRIEKAATVILDQKQYDRKYCSVKYYVESEVYKCYQILSGEPVIEPKAPERDGYSFVGWSTMSGDMADFDGENGVADSDMEFYAVFREI